MKKLFSTLALLLILSGEIFAQTPEWVVYDKTNSDIPGDNILQLHISKSGCVYFCFVDPVYKFGVFDKASFKQKSFDYTDTIDGQTKQHQILGPFYFATYKGEDYIFGTAIPDYRYIYWPDTDSDNLVVRKLHIPDINQITSNNNEIACVWTTVHPPRNRKEKAELQWVVSFLYPDSSQNKQDKIIGSAFSKGAFDTDFGGKSWSVFYDRKGSLWASDYDFDKNAYNVHSGDSANNKNICFDRLSAFDSSGNIWYTDMYSRHLIYKNCSTGETREWTPLNSPIPNAIINSIAVDKYNNIWIGTDKGLVVYRPGGVILSAEENSSKENFSLKEISPNPSNDFTTIKYSVEKNSFVELKVFDMLGREIATLASGEKSSGNYEEKFSTTNLESGAYIFRLLAGEKISSKQFLVVK